MIKADLHTHTYYSDGGQSPGDIAAGALNAGVTLISLTDHDNSCGTEEMKEVAKKCGLMCVGGEEISAYLGDVKIHILGYNMDIYCDEYRAFHKKITLGAEERTLDILQKLEAVGVHITYDEVLAQRYYKGSPVHAAYIAAAGAKKGYASGTWAFYGKYLNWGTAGFSCIGRPSPEETVESIKACGGVCSLAHPGRISMDEDKIVALISSLKDVGLDGIEAVYSGHTNVQTQYYKGQAEKFNLLVTGGSDTHFTGDRRRVGTPCFYPDERLLSALKLI